MAKEKKIKDRVIFQDNSQTSFTWKDIKHIDFQDDDEIRSEWVEPYYSENNSWDGHYSITIIRKELETDEEFQKRIDREERDLKRRKEDRYKLYIQLKNEFEN
jgi:hypothetical protein